MNPPRLIGSIICVVGVVLLVLGINATGAFGERVTQTVTGHYSDTTMWYLIGGAVCAVGGGALALFGGGHGTMKT